MSTTEYIKVLHSNDKNLPAKTFAQKRPTQTWKLDDSTLPGKHRGKAARVQKRVVLYIYIKKKNSQRQVRARRKPNRAAAGELYHKGRPGSRARVPSNSRCAPGMIDQNPGKRSSSSSLRALPLPWQPFLPYDAPGSTRDICLAFFIHPVFFFCFFHDKAFFIIIRRCTSARGLSSILGRESESKMGVSVNSD